MKPSDRQKMCPNCDGRIPFEASQCPYCFASVPVENTKESMSSTTPLYTPSYARSNASEKKAGVAAQAAVLPKQEEEAGNTPFLTILFLSLATNLFTLGVLQFFFSENGVVKLEMNAGYWLLFLLASAPLFYFGFKQAEKLK